MKVNFRENRISVIFATARHYTAVKQCYTLYRKEIMSTDSENCEKTKNVPVKLEDVKILYKYSEFNDYAYRRLLFGEFYFPDRHKLNDLYDLSLHARKPPEGTIEEMLAYINDVKVNAIKDNRPRMELYRKYYEFKRMIGKNRSLFHNSLLKVFDEKTNNVGILSLTADRWCDILMWSHYADNNKGLCIGINKEKLLDWLQDRIIRRNKVTIDPWIVKYVNRYSEVKIPNIYVGDGFNAYIRAIFEHKYKDWQYEREVRLIMTKDDKKKYNEEETSQLSNKERTIQLPLGFIEEVYVGAKCSEENLETVKNALVISNVGTKLYQIVQGEEQFTLDRKQIAY